jgi:hypothetical protein
MKFRRWSASAAILFLVCVGLFADGHVFPAANAQSKMSYSGIQVERIGVTPFFKGRYGSTIGDTLTCPICQLDLDPDGVSLIADRVLTDYVHEALRIRYGDKVIPLKEAQEAYENLPKDESKDTPLEIALKLGKELKADFMALGSVWKYREGAGGAGASDRPAAVAFAVFLVDVKTGKTLWKADFSETQKSLSENILEAKGFFKKGGRWLSASELAKYGVREVFKSFPY